MLAQNCMVVVIGWQVYDIARRSMDIRQAALQLGFVGLAQFLPHLSLALITGWTADRLDRRFIVRTSTGLQLLCALLLCWLSMNGAISIRWLLGISVLLGVARAFSMPTLSALLPNLVPPLVLPRAIATTSIAARVGGIVGPVAGGYLYSVTPFAPYLLSTGLFAISVTALFFIAPITRVNLTGNRPAWREMVEGIKYVRHNNLILGAISLDMFAVLLGGTTAMLPIFAYDVLKTGSVGLGNLRAALALGAMLTALWLSWRPIKQAVGAKMLAAVAVFGAAVLIFGMSRSLPLSLLCLSVAGAADMVSVFIRQTLIQLSTPNHLRGRVGAVSSLFISTSNELGEAESGFLAAAVGPVAAVIGGGVGAIAISILWAKWFPVLRRTNRFEDISTKG